MTLNLIKKISKHQYIAQNTPTTGKYMVFFKFSINSKIHSFQKEISFKRKQRFMLIFMDYCWWPHSLTSFSSWNSMCPQQRHSSRCPQQRTPFSIFGYAAAQSWRRCFGAQRSYRGCFAALRHPGGVLRCEHTEDGLWLQTHGICSPHTYIQTS